MDNETRFWSKVDRRGPDDCWPWTGALTSEGYGNFRVSRHKWATASRMAYELTIGELGSREADHTCHNTACCNPAHLREATSKQQKENRRGAQRNSRSGVRGVMWHKPLQCWRAQVRHNRKTIHVGYFDTIEEAEVAVIAKRNELFTHSQERLSG